MGDWKETALAKLAEMLHDEKGKASYGRIMGLVFLAGSFGLSLASGILNIIHGNSVVDDVISLSTTGFALYYGSKHLSIKGAKIAVGGATDEAVEAVTGTDAA